MRRQVMFWHTAKFAPKEPPAPASETGEAFGQIQPPKLVDQIKQRTTAVESYPLLVGQIKTKLRTLPASHREPSVGSLVRAMQKSRVPIAEMRNLLLKGSGRVNRVLEPDEDLPASWGRA